MRDVSSDFPILSRKINEKRLVYLDSAASSQKPQAVLDAMDDYYKNNNANIHRSIHTLGEEATAAYEKARETIAQFIGCDNSEVIFTKSTTESMNLLAYSLQSKISAGDEIVISQAEHHSNFVPWQQLAQRTGAKLVIIPITADGLLDIQFLEDQLSEKTKIVSLFHVSNVLGTVNDIKKINDLVKSKSNAFTVVDGAQAAPHMALNVKNLGVNFYAFSAHKMCGPTGIGVLYGKHEVLESMDPFLFGGEMISDVTNEKTTWNELPWKFEAGTPNIAEAVGLRATIEYLKSIGIDTIEQHDRMLTEKAYDALSALDHVAIVGPNKEQRKSLVSFTVDGVHPHDVAAYLDKHGIAVRAGHHCAQPLGDALNVPATVRASFALYNTEADVDALVDALRNIKEVFA